MNRCPAAAKCPSWVCAVQRRRFPVGANPTRQPLQPEAIGAVMEVTKWLKPSISVSRIGDSASVQAATRMNAEQALYGAFEVKHIFYATLYFLHSSFFVRLGIPFLRPDPHVLRPTRTGPVKAGRRAWLAAGSGVARLRLDRAEYGARINRVGRRLHRRSSSARRRVLWPAPPTRCGQACWRARSPARCGATASWRLRSRI